MAADPWTRKAGVSLCLLAIGGCVVSACNQNTGVGSSSSGSTLNYPTPQPTGVIITGPGSSSLGFTVQPTFTGLAGNAISSLFHEQSSVTSPCTIAPGTVGSAADLYCILDIPEEDLHDSALELNANIPPGMCNYTHVQLYSFYQYQPGTFNLSDTVNINDATGACTMTPAGDAQYWSGGACGGTATCPYDYTAIGGPNCCVGNASLVTIENAIASAPAVSSFGGQYSACIAGPAMDVAGFGPNAQGYPQGNVYGTLSQGITAAISIASPLSFLYGTNLYLANYFNPFDFGDVQASLPPTSNTFYPTADPAPGVAGTNPYYEFTCSDAAKDTQARIRVLIRPWDRISDFTSYTNPYTSAGQNPYDPGTEATFGGPFHDFNVWYDLSPSNPSYSSSYIGLGL